MRSWMCITSCLESVNWKTHKEIYMAKWSPTQPSSEFRILNYTYRTSAYFSPFILCESFDRFHNDMIAFSVCVSWPFPKCCTTPRLGRKEKNRFHTWKWSVTWDNSKEINWINDKQKGKTLTQQIWKMKTALSIEAAKFECRDQDWVHLRFLCVDEFFSYVIVFISSWFNCRLHWPKLGWSCFNCFVLKWEIWIWIYICMLWSRSVFRDIHLPTSYRLVTRLI
jgi:hypothetical protein